MPFNGSGVFTRVYNWANDAANSINITASRMDTEDSGFATGLSDCVTRDGQSPFTANIPAGGFKITGLGNGSAAGDSANVGQTLQVANNLSDLNSASTARTNLAVPGLATSNTFTASPQNVSTAAGNALSVNTIASSSGLAGFEGTNDGAKSLQVLMAGSAIGGTFLGVSQNNTGQILTTNGNLLIGTSAGGNVVIGTTNTAQLLFTAGGGLATSGVTGGDKGAGNINAGALYESGTALTAKYLQVSNNLSDVTAATARTNLGVTATGADSSYCKVSNNLSDVTASTAKTNLGFKTADVNLGDVNGTASSRVTGTHGLGALPVLAVAYVKNISGGTQNGYANGEYVACYAGGTSRNDGLNLSMTTTNVTANVGANGVMIIDAGTFNGTLIGGLGAGKWELHVKAISY